MSNFEVFNGIQIKLKGFNEQSMAIISFELIINVNMKRNTNRNLFSVIDFRIKITIKIVLKSLLITNIIFRLPWRKKNVKEEN